MKAFYCDGACSGNPGPGGFGVISIESRKNKNPIVAYKYAEYCDNTTNNREEMKAILHIFELSQTEEYKNETIFIYSDSAYCTNMINDWIWKWVKNDWKNSKKQIVENLDLVKKFYKYLSMDFFNCEVIKVSGHNGEFHNELADALATNNQSKYNAILHLCKWEDKN